MLFTFAAFFATAAVAAAQSTNTSQEFYLRTELISGDPKFAGLYAESYHTGAGFSDATLTSDLSVAVKSYFNATRINADFGPSLSYGWQPAYEDYSAWNRVQINAGIGTEGFVVEQDAAGVGAGGVVWTTGNSDSWIACDWTHGVPQLFWYSNYYNVSTPCGCARVRLVQEFI